MKTITIVGCGNVGSRHLQAIAKLPFPVSIDVVEPNESARQLAKLHLTEVAHKTSSIAVGWHKSICDLKRNSDLTIVATSSIGRSSIISELLEHGHSRFLIEKMVCQSAIDYEMLLRRMQARGAKGWVNTPRRYYKFYQKVRECLRSGPIHMSVAAGNVGLGTNAIHFLDLFSWFCNDYKILLKEALYDKLFPNKRGPDLVEFAGTIIGSSQDGSILEVSFLPSIEDMPLIVSITAKDMHFAVNESREKIIAEPNDCLGNEKFQNEYVSDVTTRIANDIFSEDECLLPRLQDSYLSHCELFRIFSNHIKKLTSQEMELCPIT
ncbi:MAG TPA: hypothetical protein VD736_03720 [Nitrososphaera sp.]|nr:hypothetical protein [Nitrososphaera sp.]